MFKNVKIGTLLIGVIAFIFIFCTAYMLSGAAVRMKALRSLDSTYSEYVLDVRKINALKSGIDKMDGQLYYYVTVPSARGKIRETIKQQTDAIDQTIQTLKKNKPAAEETKFLSDFEAAWPRMQRGYAEAMKAADDGKNDEAARLLSGASDLTTARTNLLVAVDGLTSSNTKRNETLIKVKVKGKGGWSGFLWMFAGVGAVILIFFGVMLTKAIANPLKIIVQMMKEIEKGHLSDRLNMNRKDELGSLSRSMDTFADKLQKNIVFSMQQIAEGNVNVKPAIADDRDEIGLALNKMIDAVASMSNEINRCLLLAQEGDLANRADTAPHKGTFKKVVQGYNDTLDAVMGPINEATFILGETAGKRDLTVQMTGNYKGDHAKIKELFNFIVGNLDKILQQVALGANQVAAATAQVSAAGQSLSQGASEQASSLEEVSSSLQEMSSMIKQNTLNAREARGVAEEARSSADKGVDSMNRMSLAINKIKSSSDATARIVKTIDEIAFQTNLLALNAAVEAARAGDAGRGFAVVAEEVRNLAMRSAEAAKNTAGLIEEAVKNSENGVTINAEVLNNFQEITSKANKVSRVVAEIAAASEQQDLGISQLDKAVEQLNLLTQHNAASAEESASAAQEMSSQAEEMRSLVSIFKLSGSGHLTPSHRIGSLSEHQLPDPSAEKKGGKARSGSQADPRMVIPLDDKDQNILQSF